MQRLFLLVFSILTLTLIFACGRQTTVGEVTPTEAYKRLYTAVKSKDFETIKKNLSKKSLEFGAMAASRSNKPIDAIYENGMTATTFSDTLPIIRDERTKDTMGALEVWNSKDSRWEDLPFILEDGAWKLAVGDAFAGSYKSPGQGRDDLEKEAANAITGPPQASNANSNAAPMRNTK